MAAPTNISAATAFVIASLPYSTTQNVHDAGTTYTVWYVYIPAADGMVDIFAFGDLIAYTAKLNVFSPDGVTHWPTGSASNVPLQFYGIAGQPYYFKIEPFPAGNPTPAVITLTASAFTATTTIPAGSIAVNDDTVGLPLALLSVADASPLNYVNPFPAGEHSDVLTSGIVAVEDKSLVSTNVSQVGIYDASLALITTFARSMPLSSVFDTLVGSNKVDTFYVGWGIDNDAGSGHPSFVTISDAGVASGVTVLEGDDMLGLAPSNDATILYYCGKDGGGDYPIKRWDLVNSVGLSNLAPNIGSSYVPQNILVLADDSIVVLYHVSGVLDDLVKIYDSTGATLHTHSYPKPLADTRIASDPTYNFYWIWTKSTGLPSRFRKITPATGVAAVDITGSLFELGAYRGSPTATPTVFFGHSESCPFWITREAIAPPTPGTDFPTIEELSQTMNCVRPGIQVVTITGTGFADGDTVMIADPEGNPVDDVIVTVVSDTEIATQFTATMFGAYCFTVTSPDDLSSHTVCTTAICEDTQTIRRLRRTTHISNENLWTYFDSLTVAYEAGTGLTSGQGSDPKLMLRWSDDGGHAWSQWHAIEIGKLGEYKHRAIWRRLGRSRNRTWELVHSDPSKIVLIDGYLDIKEGTS